MDSAAIIKEAVELLKDFEGFSPTPYYDVNGWAVGYGTHVNDPKMTVTREVAEEMLVEKVKQIVRAMNKLVKVPLKPRQAVALISFIYNVGLGAFARSTLLKKLNNGDYVGAGEEFLRWNKSNGKAVPGLSARRALERTIFHT